MSALVLSLISSPLILFAHGGGAHIPVSITPQGYEPKELFVVVGTEVEWTNEDTREHWPASNNHPTHTVYPHSGIDKCGTEEAEHIFDVCHGLAPDESWGFVFEEAGEWKYHDHLFPSLGGEVHVFGTDEERAMAEKASTPSMLDRFFERVAALFRSVAKLFGLLPTPTMPSTEEFRGLSSSERETTLTRFVEYDAAAGWHYLKEVALSNGAQVIDAHELAHIVGNALYRERGFTGIGVCDPTLAFGCYHGVAEKFLEIEGPIKTGEAADMCKNLFPQDERFQQHASCVHGLGHGLLTWHALDLKEALHSCEAVPDNVQQYCYDGVFMEFSFSASREQYSVERPWSFCEELDEKYHIPCARYQPDMMQSILGFSTERIAEECLAAGTPTLREHCIVKLGFRGAWQHKDNANEAAAFCASLFSGSARAQCVSAAAKEFVFQEFPDWKKASATLCETLSQDEKNQCFATRNETMQQYGRQ